MQRTAQWLTQSLAEAIAVLHVLHMCYVFHLPTQGELAAVCRYFNRDVVPSFQALVDADALRTCRTEVQSLADSVRQHQVLLLLQMLQLHTLDGLCEDVRQVVRSGKREAIAGCELLEYLETLLPLRDAVKQWAALRRPLASNGVTAGDIRNSGVAVAAGPVLVVWAAVAELVRALQAEAEQAFGVTPLHQVDLPGAAELGPVLYLHGPRRQQLAEHIALTEHAALPLDVWPLLRRLTQLPVFRLRPFGSTAFGLGEEVNAAAAACAGVDLGAAAGLRECLAGTLFESLNVVLQAFDLGTVFHENFGDVMAVACATVRFLSVEAVEALATALAPGGAAPAEVQGSSVTALLQHALEVFPVHVEPLPQVLAALGQAAARAARVETCGTLYDTLCTMTGFAVQSSLQRQGTDWELLAYDEAQALAPTFCHGPQRVYVRACRDAVLTYSFLSITVPAGTVGVVVAQGDAGQDEAEDAVLLRWHVQYSGWFFLYQLLQTPPAMLSLTAAEVAQRDTLDRALAELLATMCIDPDLEEELDAHLNGILAQLGRPTEPYLVVDAALGYGVGG